MLTASIFFFSSIVESDNKKVERVVFRCLYVCTCIFLLKKLKTPEGAPNKYIHETHFDEAWIFSPSLPQLLFILWSEMLCHLFFSVL